MNDDLIQCDGQMSLLGQPVEPCGYAERRKASAGWARCRLPLHHAGDHDVQEDPGLEAGAAIPPEDLVSTGHPAPSPIADRVESLNETGRAVMAALRPHFDGETYDPVLDHERLTRQVDRVLSALFDARRNGDETAHALGVDPGEWGWITLRDLSNRLGIPEASVSARLRDLRKPRFGGFTVLRRRHEDQDGLWLYRLAGDLQPVREQLGAAAGS